MAVEIGQLRVALSASAVAFSKNMQKARASVQNNSRLMSSSLKTLGNAYDRTAKAAKIAASALAIGGAYAVTRGLKESVVIGMQFEQQMLRVGAVMRASDDEFEALTKAARKMGASTEYTATQAAEALTFLGMAGFESSKAIKALPGVLDLATASGIDLGMAADIASNVLTAMRLPVEELGRVNDVFIGTTTRSNVNMEQMAEAFKYAAPVAQAFGYSIEELAAYVGELGNAGIQGTMAGTALAKSFQAVEGIFRKAGVDGTGKKLVDALELIREKGWKTQQVIDEFGDRAAKSALALLGLTGETRKLTNDLENAAGESNKLAEVIRSSLLNQFKVLRSTIEDIAIEGFEKYKEKLKESVEKGTELIRLHKDEFVEAFGKIPGLVDDATASLERLYEFYKKVPDGVIGATGAGLIGTLLFGKKIGIVLATAVAVKGIADDILETGKQRTGMEHSAYDYFGIPDPSKIDLPRVEKIAQDAASHKQKTAVATTNETVATKENTDATKENTVAKYELSEAETQLRREAEMFTDSLNSMNVSDADVIADLNYRREKFVKDEEVRTDNALTFFFNALDEQAEKHRETYEELTEFEKQAYRNMESYAGQAFFDIMKGNYDNLLDSFIDMVQRMISEWMAAQATMALFGPEFGKGGKLGGLLGGLAKGIGSAIKGSSGGWDFATWDAGGGGNIMKFASGGMINEPVLGIGKSGQSYLFGESGPEMVSPAGSGGGGTVNININAVDAASFHQLARRNPGAIIGPMMSQMQKGNTSLRSTMRKTR